MSNLVRACVLLVSILGTINASRADDAAKIFQSKCGGCHTVGGGALVGPDLAPTKNWNEGDLKSAVTRMQKMSGPLSDQEIAQLVTYLKMTPVAASEKAPVAEAPPAVAVAASPPAMPAATGAEATGSASTGEMLFNGKKALANGGMSCIACHSINGAAHGTLGPDLKNIGTKMNEASLLTSCELTPFKVMKAAYSKHPVTHQEAADMAKYLVVLKDKSAVPDDQPIVVYGLAGAAALLAIVALAYRNRNTDVRSKLHRR